MERRKKQALPEKNGGTINTVKKGNKNQNKARKLLEKRGWLVYTAIRVRFHEIDIWGLFDIIAHKDGYIKLIQVKSNHCPKEVIDRIKAFCTDGVFVTREVWVYKDYSKVNPWITIIR